jgi:hypothetical protein
MIFEQDTDEEQCFCCRTLYQAASSDRYTSSTGERGRIVGVIGNDICVSVVELNVRNNSDLCAILFSPHFT